MMGHEVPGLWINLGLEVTMTSTQCLGGAIASEEKEAQEETKDRPASSLLTSASVS